VVFERITNVLMDKQAPTVVIDSWESLSDALGSEALRTNIRVLQTWRERAGARFIFIGEDPGNTAIDFMVEGVVVLKDRVAGGRRIREMVLSKLHGAQISRPSYYFTLQGGTFRSAPPYSPKDYAFRNPLPVSFDRPFRRMKSKFPTGYASLDEILDGGFPSKSMVVVEVGRLVDPKTGLIFLSRAVQDWLLAGDRVVIEKIPGVESQYLAQFSRSFGGRAKGQLAIPGVRRGAVRRRKPGREEAAAKERTMVVVPGGGARGPGTAPISKGRRPRSPWCSERQRS
jgi:KaiC/GvpD/RAD55 family RecA-like ATPase